MQDKIGETAGKIWHALADEGPQNVTQLVSKVEEKNTLVHQALGWLAREGRIEIKNEGKKTVIFLKK